MFSGNGLALELTSDRWASWAKILISGLEINENWGHFPKKSSPEKKSKKRQKKGHPMPNNDSDAPISYAFWSPRIPIALKQRSESEISIHRLTLDKNSVLPLL